MNQKQMQNRLNCRRVRYNELKLDSSCSFLCQAFTNREESAAGSVDKVDLYSS